MSRTESGIQGNRVGSGARVDQCLAWNSEFTRSEQPTTCQWNLVYGGFTNYSHSVAFGYDENGNVTTASGFDGLDRLRNVVCSTLGKSMSGTYAYNENGKVASMNAHASGPTGPALTYSYDSENRLSGIAGKLGPPTVLFLAYAYNSAQQITNIAERLSETTNTHAYSYDDRDQLAGEKIPEVTSGYNVCPSSAARICFGQLTGQVATRQDRRRHELEQEY